MRHAFVIARREIESYFVSPIAYAVMTIFTFVSGLFFSNMLVYYIRQSALADAQMQKFGRAELQLDVPTVVLAQFFQNEAFLLMFALPTWASHRRTAQGLLITSPFVPQSWSVQVPGSHIPLHHFSMFWFMVQGGDWPGRGRMLELSAGGAQIALGRYLFDVREHPGAASAPIS